MLIHYFAIRYMLTDYCLIAATLFSLHYNITLRHFFSLSLFRYFHDTLTLIRFRHYFAMMLR